MTTERDVYELDASNAIDQLKKLAMGQLEFSATAEDGKLKMLAIGAAWAAGTAALSALSAGISASAELLKNSVTAYHEAEQADMRRARALKSVTMDVEKWNNRLAESASAFERLTGVDDEYYAGLQTLLTTFGVAPEQLNRFTRAALDLAAATGQDATMAAKLLARAHAEGKDELKKYGIAVDETTFQAQGFKAVLAQVEQRFGGLHTEIPEQVKSVNNLKGAWETFKETLGGVVSNAVNTAGAMDKVASVIDTLGWTLHRLTNSTAQNKLEDTSPEKLKAQQMVEADQLRQHLSGKVTMYKTWGPAIEDQVVLPFKEAAKRLAALEKDLQPKWLNDLKTAGTIRTPVHVMTDEEKAAQKAAQKKAIAENKKYLDEKETLFATSASNLEHAEKLDEAKALTATREKIAKLGDLNEEEVNEYRAAQAAKYEWEHSLAVEAENKRMAMQDKAREREKEFYADLLNELAGYAKQALDFVGNLIAEQLTQNKAYNDAYFAASVERRVIDKQEEEQDKLSHELKRALTDEEIDKVNALTDAKYTSADAEKELKAEAKAAEQKRLAEFLASIAKEAGVRAIMEAAEAIASLAKYDYPGAAQHGVAAGAFAAVAVATGAAAAGISGSRGMTREEKDSIKSLEKRDAEKKERASQTTDAKTGPGVNQYVYYFGISGMTDVGQAAELDRLRRKHAQLQTGA